MTSLRGGDNGTSFGQNEGEVTLSPGRNGERERVASIADQVGGLVP